ncbi:3-isopropylmalate dehydratase large subunit [Oligoflexus tunisiensis]|uniref:3-isopropylmalate dehydratase large subunit n=1 Tax=Oligoflexus tunisiensis TaxID=708132 RepID=UPI000AE1EB32|nr:3-isopropylmalate dehydratase large subunit [Oligoflexus tunisiensis]
MHPRTLLDKIWTAHEVAAESADHPAVLYIDRHLVHEVTSPQAFTELRQRGLRVRRPDQTFATLDHSIPTDARREAYVDDQARQQVETLRRNCQDFAIPLFDLGSASQGIIHVIAPELGLTLPGQTIVCGDSHTSTHGAFGALAFGIGTSEVGHVLATQCLLQKKPKTLAVHVEGQLGRGVTAKDLILAIIQKLGAGGGTGYVLEYRGPAINALDMEARMTLCNMSIEAGAKAGLIAPDERTFAFLKDRPYAPSGADWNRALEDWRQLRSDPDAVFDREILLDASRITPMVTFGTSPDQAIGIQEVVPADEQLQGARAYMEWQPGQKVEGAPIDVVFIGSCTNSRISDLRAAAKILKGRRIAPGLRLMVVPGSVKVKKQAEVEGLARIFLDAGAEWREPGCSMCIAMNGDQLQPGQLAVSTSNRNFAGRQGKGSRTILASPLTAAATAVTGHLTDPRVFLL